MKKLKQAFAKQQPKKNKNINLSSTLISSKKSKPSQYHSIFLCKSPSKNNIAETGLDNLVTSIIQSSVKNSTIFNIDKVVKEIIQKCEENQKFNTVFKEKARLNRTVQNQQLKKLEEIKELVQQILDKNDQSYNSKQNLLIFNQQLNRVIKNKNKITKKQKLDQYDRLIKMLSPRKIPKSEKILQIANLSSVSPRNVNVKISKQEVEIKRQQSHEKSLRKLVSQGKRVKTAGSSHSNFKSQNGHQKLKKLLENSPSVKIVKTKVSYDYSAILEASKSKIQPRSRNVTTVNQKKSNANDITTKLNKVKKNEGFVFYRPSTGHKKQ